MYSKYISEVLNTKHWEMKKHLAPLHWIYTHWLDFHLKDMTLDWCYVIPDNGGGDGAPQLSACLSILTILMSNINQSKISQALLYSVENSTPNPWPNFYIWMHISISCYRYSSTCILHAYNMLSINIKWDWHCIMYTYHHNYNE